MKQGERDWSILDRLHEGCQIIDRDWKYLYLNTKACEHARKSIGELVGQRMVNMYPGIEKTDLFEKLKGCMENRTRDKFTNEFAHPDGVVGFYELVVEPVPEGLMVLALDLTAQHSVEQKIEDKYALLKSIANMVSIQSQSQNQVVMQVLSRFESELYFKYFTNRLPRNLRTFGRVVCKIYNDIGGTFICQGDDHNFCLHGSACPWDNQTVCNPVYCKIMRGMIFRFGENFLGKVSVRQSSSLGKGDGECEFLVSC